MSDRYDPRFIGLQHPDDLVNLDGLTAKEYQDQLLYGIEPAPEPEPTPLHPLVTRGIIAVFAAQCAACAWFTGGWVRNTGIAFAVLLLCLAILPARRRRRR